MLVALVAGAGAARADEADVDAPDASQTSDAPDAPDAPPAADAPDPPQAPEAPRTSWYGWQTLVADAGVIALWSAAYAVDDAKYGSTSKQSYELGTNLLVASNVAVYFFGSPAIH